MPCWGFSAADIDLATTLRPDAVMARARAAGGLQAVPTGIAHGTVTLIAEDGPIEVTTLREDIETDGRHAVVRFGSDFARDAERRDFTVNALSLGTDGQLHDTVGGWADLACGRVRFIGDPATRIREDALRILRFFRFHARFGREAPDAAALAACVSARDSLDRLSRERVRDEVLKLLAATGGPAMVVTLSGTGLLQRITGGIGELGRLERAAAAGLPPVMRLAALAVAGRHDADRLRDRLRLSKQEHAQLTGYADAVADLHDRAPIGATDARTLAAGHGLPRLTAALAILAGEPRPAVSEDAWRTLRTMDEAGSVPTFPLTGADLVAAGVAPGAGDRPRACRGTPALAGTRLSDRIGRDGRAPSTGAGRHPRRVERPSRSAVPAFEAGAGGPSELEKRLGLPELDDLAVQVLALLQILGGIAQQFGGLDILVEGFGRQFLDRRGTLGQHGHGGGTDIGEPAADIDALAAALALGDDDDADPQGGQDGGRDPASRSSRPRCRAAERRSPRRNTASARGRRNQTGRWPWPQAFPHPKQALRPVRGGGDGGCGAGSRAGAPPAPFPPLPLPDGGGDATSYAAFIFLAFSWACSIVPTM